MNNLGEMMVDIKHDNIHLFEKYRLADNAVARMEK